MGTQIRIARLLPVLALALVLTIAACSDDEATPNVVTIEGGEFSFTLSGEFQAGTNEIILENVGEQVHHVQLVQIDGHTLGELMGGLAAVEEGAPFPEWARFAGGVGQLAPGLSGSVTDDLPAGTYALLCFVPDTDGVPHFAKGMATTVEVGGDVVEADLPEADITVIGLDDGAGVSYSFDAPASVDAGEVTIEFTNDGAEPHEVNVFRLDGITFEQFMGALASTEAPTGPPPFAPVGDVQGVLPGVSQVGTLDLDAGSYALICFIPSPTGVPHFVGGMVRALNVE